MSFFGRTPAFFGGSFESFTFTSDTEVGDLYTFFGSPIGPKNFTITADNCDVARIVITNDFHPSSTFQITAINGARFVGLGGNGGDGADDNGTFGGIAGRGSAGGHAIACSAPFTVNVDIDDGYLFGGGGGGGGGGFKDEGTTGDPGGGGGGGQGFGTSTGGDAGNPSGFPVANNGAPGDVNGPGGGGSGGDLLNSGGAGGSWAEAGGVGGSPSLTAQSQVGAGGAGGNAGSAFYPTNGASINFNGVQGESGLRLQSRLIGEIFGRVDFGQHFLIVPSFQIGLPKQDVSSGWDFNSNGTLDRIGGQFGPEPNGWYLGSGFTSSDYSVRDRTEAFGTSWTVEPGGGVNTWRQLNVGQLWRITEEPPYSRIQMFEIRRNSTDTVLARGWIDIEAEWEP